MSAMIYCLNPACPHPQNPAGNIHCQYCGRLLTLRNRFKVLQLLGQGGFGKTYRAEDLDNRNKPCVVKRLTYQGADELSKEKAKQLFEQEAERLDQLVHPQIPRLLAYFQEGGYLYLVQEVIEGQTLQAELQREGPFDEGKVKAVLQGLLPVLQFVHSRSVIHRDIKPDNIMRRRSGELVLIDFGVAKVLEQSGFSKSATTIGTPGYAAPEQIQGKVTPASDLFALGATCFQLLSQALETGEVPLVGYRWVQHWPKYVKRSLTPEFTTILTRLLAVDDRQRYPTAAAVLQDLSSPQSSIGTPSPTSTASPSAMPTQQRLPHPFPNPRPPNPKPNPKKVRPSANASPAQPNALPVQNRPKNRPSSVPLAAVPNGQAPNGQSPGNLAKLPPTQAVSPARSPRKLPINKVPVSLGFWMTYGIRSYIGQAVGFLVAAVVTAGLTFSTHPNPTNMSAADVSSALTLLYWMHWPVAGFFVGFAQWLAIRKWLPGALWWLPATVAGFWMIALAIATGYTSELNGALVGGWIGLVQWAALRGRTPRAHWWFLCTIPLTAILFEMINQGALRTLGWLLLAPLCEGLFLSWVLRRQHSDQRNPPGAITA
ncbi:MAG: protein kinase [Cyanobacteria bacterium J06607_13]